MSSTTTKPHLPLSRINTIMKSSSDAETISKESSQLMSKAAELFIRSLAEQGYKHTENGKKLNYKHIAEVVNTDERYEFVRDIMPRKITVAEYKRIMKAKRKQANGQSESSSEESGSEDESGDSSSSND